MKNYLPIFFTLIVAFLFSSIGRSQCNAITGNTNICVGSTSNLNTSDFEWTTYPTGGTITTVGNDRIHTFTSTGIFTISNVLTDVKVLLVGGGGGGGYRHAGGGGAGGVRFEPSINLFAVGSYQATIGSGGTGSTGQGRGGTGLYSSFSTFYAYGGGGGGDNAQYGGNTPGFGGSGGGGSNGTSGGFGSTYGTNGGSQNGGGNTCSIGQCYAKGCGGGGAGAAAASTTGDVGSAGGFGLTNNITGANVRYGGGGGGGRADVNTGYAGGSGGGGRGGGASTLTGTNGTANRGGGGGGGGANGGSSGSGGNGGSGIVILRYTPPRWTSSNTAIATVDILSGLVTGVSSGTSTITYYSPDGSVCSTTVTVSVGSTTITTVSATAATICAGDATTLTASGGISGDGADVYWYANACGLGGTVVGTGNSISVSPSSTTRYYCRREGTCNVSGCNFIDINVNQPSVAPAGIVPSANPICLGQNIVLTRSGGTPGTGAILHWYANACGGSSIGIDNTIQVSPSVPTLYFARYEGLCNTTSCAAIYIDVRQPSTAPAIGPVPASVCPNTDITLTASGGTAGSGSNIYWRTAPNGAGPIIGAGSSIVVAPNVSTTYYARREGPCNITSDASVTVNVKSFIYAANGTSTNTYCTDNAGWNHFFNGNNIIFSVNGDLSGVPVGYPVATIYDNGTYYQETEGPGTAPACGSSTPGEERFEMQRSWNLDFGGGTPNGNYRIRFYSHPSERAAIENAAAAWIAAYPSCGYTYKYATPLGFYWFKNTGTNYLAADYDGTHHSAINGTVSGSGVNFSEWNGITSFSGGSGAIILQPLSTLPVELTSFAAVCEESGEEISVRWTTASEHNSSHFSVDRSTDGIDWKVLGTVNAAENSTTKLNYELIDSDRRGNSVVYYRLNQIDLDGKVETYGMVSANCLNEENDFEVFPNPAGTNVTVLLRGDYLEGETDIVFTDLNGKEVKRITFSDQTGKLMNLDLRNLDPGVYLIRIIDSSESKRFVRLIKK